MAEEAVAAASAVAHAEHERALREPSSRSVQQADADAALRSELEQAQKNEQERQELANESSKGKVMWE